MDDPWDIAEYGEQHIDPEVKSKSHFQKDPERGQEDGKKDPKNVAVAAGSCHALVHHVVSNLSKAVLRSLFILTGNDSASRPDARDQMPATARVRFQPPGNSKWNFAGGAGS